jgi:hypothetical protein
MASWCAVGNNGNAYRKLIYANASMYPDMQWPYTNTDTVVLHQQLSLEMPPPGTVKRLMYIVKCWPTAVHINNIEKDVSLLELAETSEVAVYTSEVSECCRS